MCRSRGGGGGGGGGTGGSEPPEKSQKYLVSKQYWSGSSEKSQSCQASIQCWAIICMGPSSARQRNSISMAFCWWADDGPLLVVFGSSLPSSSTKNTQKCCQSWTPSYKTFWIRACRTLEGAKIRGSYCVNSL